MSESKGNIRAAMTAVPAGAAVITAPALSIAGDHHGHDH